MDRASFERLERHPLPQSTLHTPLFAGVEPPIVGFELVVVVGVVNLTQLALVPLLVTGAILAVLHALLAAATARDRRLNLVFARSVRHPRSARPWPTRTTAPRTPEPSFPRRPLP